MFHFHASMQPLIRLLCLVITPVLTGLSLRASTPTPPEADWRLHALSATATAGSASFADGMTTGSDVSAISVGAGGSWTGTVRIPATSAGGMLTFSFALTSNLSTAGYTASAQTSLDSTNGVDGTWTSLPLSLYRADRRVYNKLQKVAFDTQARWIRLTVRAPAGEAGAVRDLGLYAFSPDGLDDYWLCVGASIQERGVNNTAFKSHIRDVVGRDPVIFNVSIGGYTTDDWYDGYPNNLLKQVLDAHPRARYVAIHIGGNNVTDQRPYVDAATDPGDKNMADDLAGIIDQVISAGRYPLVSRISFRDYPSPDPVNAGANPENGALPYNIAIVDPLIANRVPEQINAATGVSFIDAYAYFAERQSLLSSDGVHLNTDDELIWSSELWAELAAPIVYGLPRPVILAAPASVAAAAGDNVRLSVAASGSSLTYQWYRNGVAIDGATAATLALSDVGSSQLGDYTVKVSANGGFPALSTATTVAPPVAPMSSARTLLLDFGSSSVTNPASGLYWNQITRMTTGDAASAGSLLDDGGNTVANVGLQIGSNFGGNMTGSLTSVTNASSYPLNAASDGFYINGEDTTANNGVGPSGRATLVFTGLDPASVCDLGIFGSRQFSDRRVARITVNGTSVAHLDCGNNTANTLEMTSLSPDSSGRLTIEIEALDASGALQRYAYLNVLRLTIKDREDYTRWQDRQLPSPLVSASDREAAADADGDGIPNLVEFATGTDPLDAMHRDSPREFAFDPAGGTFSLDLRRARAVSVITTYQTSDDLVTWFNVAASESVLDDDMDGDGRVQLIRATIPSGNQSPIFVRARFSTQ